MIFICEICGYQAKSITSKHLDRHGITMREYREKYPNAPVASKMSESARSHLKEKWENMSVDEKNARVEKITNTSILRHGGQHHTKCDAVKIKAKNTNLTRYGKTHSTDIARKAFLDKNGGNPFTIPDVKEKIKKTNLERYGVEHPAQRPEHKEKIRSTSRNLYDRDNHSQLHISPENLAILKDEKLFTSMMRDNTMTRMGELLGVGGETISRYCSRYGIEREGSSLEVLMKNILDDLSVEYTRWDRQIIKPLELDFILPQHHLAIEVGGLFHHSDYYLKNPSYHLDKMRKAENSGYRLLTLFEDELHHKKDIVSARIKNIVGMSERGEGARKLECRKVDKNEAYSFLSQHHIQGGSKKSSICYGAFSNNDLVAVMTFTKGAWRVGDSLAFELDRFSTDGRSYAGIASKLFKGFIRDFSPERVISYADRRWSQGHLYMAIGFAKTNVSRPSYTYFKNKVERIDKTKFRKSKIIDLVPDGENKSESQIMHELGYKRIYDCGNIRFEWKPKT